MWQPRFLIPQTVLRSNGAGEAVALTSHPILQLTLMIESVVEQQSLDVHIEGSSDGVVWMEKPLAAFPQKFYPGPSVILCDLGKHHEVQFLRATWKVHRWGRGDHTPSFGVYLFAETLELSATARPPATSAVN